MEEEVIVVIKPKRAAAKESAPETHVFDTIEEAYLFLGERADQE